MTDRKAPKAVEIDGRIFINSIPHARALGLEIVSVEPGVAAIRLPFADHLVGDPRRGTLHGGVVSTLMDTTSGLAVVSHPEAGLGTATLDLRMDYMRAATPGQDLTARAECYHVTRNAAFVRVLTYDEDPDNLVASGHGVFTISEKTLIPRERAK